MFEKVRNIGKVQTVEMYGKEYLTTESVDDCVTVYNARHHEDGTCCLSNQKREECMYLNTPRCARLKMGKQYDTLLDSLRKMFGKK